MHQHRRAQWALFVLFLIGFSLAGHAQGSPYNNIGFGLPVTSGNELIEALGGTGVAMGGTRIVNDLNPADWTWVTRARFSASLHYDLDNATQNGVVDFQQNVQFSGAAFAAPVWNRYKATIALGYVPLTNANDDINESNTVSSENYIVRGGTNLIFAGVAARPVPSIAFGARLDLITGDIRHIAQVNFADTEAASSQFESDDLFYGVRPTFGLQIIGDSIADALNGITIGATYSFAAKLNSTSEMINTPVSSTDDTTIDVSGVGRYPASFSAGLSFHLSRRYRVEADYFAQNFSTAYVYAPQAIAGDTMLRNSNRIAVGIERMPNLNNEYSSSSGLDRWGLRLGFSYGLLPIDPVSNSGVSAGGVREYSVSGGVGIPISFYESFLDLSFTVGQRVPLNAGAAPNDTFVRLGADVSFSEQWFVPTRRE
jgi:hypothetical protein